MNSSKKKSIAEIKALLERVQSETDPFYQACLLDERKGVQQLLLAWSRKRAKQFALEQRFKEMQYYENKAKAGGAKYIAGIDEVGRGPLAGPVVAAAVILPESFNQLEVFDSKQLSFSKREFLYDRITEEAISFHIGIVPAEVIDKINIYEATKVAMAEAIQGLIPTPDHLLIDAMVLPVDIPQDKIIKGDAKSISIAAASIVAKVTRDRMMVSYDEKYPGYGFAKNAGYGTKEHLEGLQKLGASPIHRRSFAPIKDM